jgi:hypothetical protein
MDRVGALDMVSVSQSIGRAKTVLVFGRNSSQKAVTSAILVRPADPAAGERLRFVGAVEFSPSVQRHVRDIILPIVDHILEELQVPRRHYEISAVNLGAASALDVGTSVSGFSADVPIFLALLSAGLDLPLPDDLVSTGHIASVEADIAAVRALAAKVQAAVADGSIGCFLYPDLDKDKSLGVLSPQERDRSVAAVQGARDSLYIKPVGGIGELVREVFAEEQIVQASLKTGFFLILKRRPRCENPLPNAVYLLANNRRRFWRVLEQLLLAGQADRARELLRAFAQFHADRQSYPSHFGQRLLRLFRSLPPAVWRAIPVPMIDFALCVAVVKGTRARDGEDVFALFDAVRGRRIERDVEPYPAGSPPEPAPSDPEGIALGAIASQITEQTLARRIGIPIDSARGCYVLASSTIETYHEFLDTLAAFYIHLQRHLHPNTVESPDMARARSQALDLLKEVFRGEEGDKAAFARARDGIDGGMRVILDLLTEQFKRDEQALYVQRVFKEAMPVDWNERVAFMRGAMKWLGTLLPADLRDEPPERFAGRPEAIIQVFVESLDRVNRIVSTL